MMRNIREYGSFIFVNYSKERSRIGCLKSDDKTRTNVLSAMTTHSYVCDQRLTSEIIFNDY